MPGATCRRTSCCGPRSNTAPDVGPALRALAAHTSDATKGVVDFNDVFGQDQLAAILAPAVLAMGQVDGKQLGIPLMTGSIGMIANKEVLAKAGVDRSQARSTSSARRSWPCATRCRTRCPYAMATKNNNSIILDYMIWTWAHGGQIIDSEGNVKVGASPAGKQAAGLHGRADEGPPRRAGNRPSRLAPPVRTGASSAFYFDAPQARGFIRNFSGRGEAIDAAITPVTTPVREGRRHAALDRVGPRADRVRARRQDEQGRAGARSGSPTSVGRGADRLHARPERAAGDQVRA